MELAFNMSRLDLSLTFAVLSTLIILDEQEDEDGEDLVIELWKCHCNILKANWKQLLFIAKNFAFE